MAITEEQAAVVGQDVGSPVQNPVPYQRDPFEGAQVQEGTGSYTERVRAGVPAQGFIPLTHSIRALGSESTLLIPREPPM